MTAGVERGLKLMIKHDFISHNVLMLMFNFCNSADIMDRKDRKNRKDRKGRKDRKDRKDNRT